MNTPQNIVPNGCYAGSLQWSPVSVKIRLNTGKIVRLGQHPLAKAKAVANELGLRLHINEAFGTPSAKGENLQRSNKSTVLA